MLTGPAADRRSRLEDSLRSLESGMEALTPELKSEIGSLLEEAERAASEAFLSEAVGGVAPALAEGKGGFDRVFHDDPASAVVYRDRLVRHLEEAVRGGLETKLAREVCSRVDQVQEGIVSRRDREGNH